MQVSNTAKPGSENYQSSDTFVTPVVVAINVTLLAVVAVVGMRIRKRRAFAARNLHTPYGSI
jgi:hypothetical protein